METVITKLCKWRDETGGDWRIESGRYDTFSITMNLTIHDKKWGQQITIVHRDLYGDGPGCDLSFKLEREVDYMIYKFKRQMEVTK